MGTEVVNDPEMQALLAEYGRVVAAVRARCEALCGRPLSERAIVEALLAASAAVDERALAAEKASPTPNLASVRALSRR